MKALDKLLGGQQNLIGIVLLALLILGLTIVVDVVRSRALGRVARKYQSDALEADALHFSTDIWSSSVVILGLILVLAGRFRPAWSTPSTAAAATS